MNTSKIDDQIKLIKEIASNNDKHWYNLDTKTKEIREKSFFHGMKIHISDNNNFNGKLSKKRQNYKNSTIKNYFKPLNSMNVCKNNNDELIESEFHDINNQSLALINEKSIELKIIDSKKKNKNMNNGLNTNIKNISKKKNSKTTNSKNYKSQVKALKFKSNLGYSESITKYVKSDFSNLNLSENTKFKQLDSISPFNLDTHMEIVSNFNNDLITKTPNIISSNKKLNIELERKKPVIEILNNTAIINDDKIGNKFNNENNLNIDIKEKNNKFQNNIINITLVNNFNFIPASHQTFLKIKENKDSKSIFEIIKDKSNLNLISNSQQQDVNSSLMNNLSDYDTCLNEYRSTKKSNKNDFSSYLKENKQIKNNYISDDDSFTDNSENSNYDKHFIFDDFTHKKFKSYIEFSKNIETPYKRKKSNNCIESINFNKSSNNIINISNFKTNLNNQNNPLFAKSNKMDVETPMSKMVDYKQKKITEYNRNSKLNLFDKLTNYLFYNITKYLNLNDNYNTRVVSKKFEDRYNRLKETYGYFSYIDSFIMKDMLDEYLSCKLDHIKLIKDILPDLGGKNSFLKNCDFKLKLSDLSHFINPREKLKYYNNENDDSFSCSEFYKTYNREKGILLEYFKIKPTSNKNRNSNVFLSNSSIKLICNSSIYTLKELVLNGCPKIGDSIGDYISECQLLKGLSITDNENISSLFLEKISNMPNLKSLNLSNCRNINCISSLKKLNLNELNLSNCDNIDNFYDLKSQEYLKKLIIDRTKIGKQDCLGSIVSFLPNLTHLSIELCFENDDTVYSIIQNSLKLMYLKVDKRFMNNKIEEILNYRKNLYSFKTES